MTTDIDRMIEEALQGEEQALFRETAREPGFFGQAFGLFGGPNGWVNGVMMAAQAALFVVGVWAAWRFFEAGAALGSARGGAAADVPDHQDGTDAADAGQPADARAETAAASGRGRPQGVNLGR